MTEEVVLEVPKTTVFDGFSEVEVSVDKTQKPEIKTEIKSEPIKEKIAEKIEDKTPIVPTEDGRTFLKEKLGYEDWDSAKSEIESLRSKSQTPAEIKYANEKSKQLAEAWQSGKTEDVYKFLDAEIKLNKLTTGEVTENNASEIIKTQWKERYKGLNDSQIDYKFNKQFGVPKEPVIKEDELPEDFEARQNEWKDKVEESKMEMLIEANLARPELEKLKSELKLPVSEQTQQVEKEPTPEELVEFEKNKDAFLQNAKAEIEKFEGFTVEHKDKDVDIKTTYSLSDEEKASILEKMQLLAEKNYNSNFVFAERWVNDDSTFNFNQMAKDLAILESYEKQTQKFVGDAAAKATKQFIKEKHNIDLNNGAGNGELQLEDKETQKKNEDTIWGLN